jgi:cytoskeletal protein RodZ
MVDTAGKKLKQARLRKQLSLEDAARATKIRVPRLTDLENDDYANFPSMAYVRGFLTIYARFLGVDVSEYTESLGSTVTSVGIADYEYLTNAPDPVQPVVHRKIKRKIWPLVLFVIVLVLGILALPVMKLLLTYKRLEPGQKQVSESAGVPEADLGSKAGRSIPVPSPAMREDQAFLSSSASQPKSEPEVRRAEPVTPGTPSASAAPSPDSDSLRPPQQSSDLAAKEVLIKAVKKTWVKITKDSPDTAPVYEDWIFPGTLGIRLTGNRIYIQASDPSGLQISRNGVSQPVDQSSLTIQ